MKLPSASMFIIMFFLLSLLSITTNANPVNNKLISKICPKTKSPENCVIILSTDRNTRSASTLHGLGFDSLTIAISRAKISASVFSTLMLKGKYLPQKQKNIYMDCIQDYSAAMTKLEEAKDAWSDKKYPLAKKSIEIAQKRPISCEKAFGAPPSMSEARRAIKTADITFDIALVVAKEMVANGNNETMDS